MKTQGSCITHTMYNYVKCDKNEDTRFMYLLTPVVMQVLLIDSDATVVLLIDEV